MTRLRHQPLLWLNMAVVCRDKPDATDTRAGDQNPAPRATRADERPRGNPAGAGENPGVAPPAAAVSNASDAREKSLAEAAWDSLESDREVTREAFLQLSLDNTENRPVQH